MRTRFTHGHVWKLVLGLLVLLAIGLVVGFFMFRGDDEQAFQLRAQVSSQDAAFASALHQSLGVELRPGHHVALLDNGAIFDGIEAEVRKASRGIHAVVYIWEKGGASDRLVAALSERAKAGVECRILVDAFGSPDFGRDVRPALEAAGCEVRVFRPPPVRGDELARNHRKIVVIDGRVAFTGGFGVRDDWLGDGVSHDAWRDANVRFSGAAVGAAQQAFAENWQEAGGGLLPRDAFPAPDAGGPALAAFVASTGSPVLTRAERLIQLMIQASSKRLWIANAYFVPSTAILTMIKRKSSAGVDVRLLAPGKKSDSKTSFGAQHIEYGELLEQGVRVFEYQPSMMHSKTMLVDDELALVGSINFDPLSLGSLEEAALVVHDGDFAAELARTFEADCRHAKELTSR
ncbi:MAG TPA: phospholipase D-like domain-containing protein [Polyangiaceae bacterium]